MYPSLYETLVGGNWGSLFNYLQHIFYNILAPLPSGLGEEVSKIDQILRRDDEEPALPRDSIMCVDQDSQSENSAVYYTTTLQ